MGTQSKVVAIGLRIPKPVRFTFRPRAFYGMEWMGWKGGTDKRPHNRLNCCKSYYTSL